MLDSQVRQLWPCSKRRYCYKTRVNSHEKLELNAIFCTSVIYEIRFRFIIALCHDISFARYIQLCCHWRFMGRWSWNYNRPLGWRQRLVCSLAVCMGGADGQRQFMDG